MNHDLEVLRHYLMGSLEPLKNHVNEGDFMGGYKKALTNTLKYVESMQAERKKLDEIYGEGDAS